jgi:HEAT repeat protein
VDWEEANDEIQHVATALEPLAKVNQFTAHYAAAKALRRWGTEKSVPTLILLTKSSGARNDRVRHEACMALANIKDPRGAVVLAEMFKSGWGPDHGNAKQALIAWGPGAEQAVIDVLECPNASTYPGRASAVAVLKEIGTAKSLRVLADLQDDARVGGEASSALAAIRARYAAKGEKCESEK